MKRILAILLSVLLAAALSAACADEQPAGFTVPEPYRTISARLDRNLLPRDLPAEPVVITAASLEGSSLSLELSAPVPSLTVVQYTSNNETIVCATAENTAALSADTVDASLGMAEVTMSWEIDSGVLTSSWIVWEDNTFDFYESRFAAETENDRFAPFTREERVIELDEQMQVLSDSRLLSNDADSFSLSMEYDASGKLTDYSCQWATEGDSSLFFIRSSADGIPSGISWYDGGTAFIASSDNLDDYFAGRSGVLDTVGYDEAFIAALKAVYPQMPEPEEDFPVETIPATPSDIDTAGLQGSLWCLGFCPEDSCSWLPFVTADPLFVFGEGSVSLNAEAKDLNGAVPDFAGRIPALPAFELPAVQ